MRLVLLGPPGSGKGTQARKLQDELRAPHISTGDILRAAVQEGSDLGRTAKGYMDAGQLVPDEVVIGLVEERLRRDAEAGDVRFILDGFPRTVAQAEALDRALEQSGTRLDAAIALDVDAGEVVRRLSGRRICGSCGAMYHVEFQAPRKAGVCDACGGELHQRDDDREETVRQRLRVYEEQTAPLISYYAGTSRLVRVHGEGGVDEIHRRFLEALAGAREAK